MMGKLREDRNGAVVRKYDGDNRLQEFIYMGPIEVRHDGYIALLHSKDTRFDRPLNFDQLDVCGNQWEAVIVLKRKG